MLISAIIPAFNAGRFINRTIDSILTQTYRDYEIIVVDDGSTDDTADIVKNYGDKVTYIYQDNSGDGAARNTGIAAAKGDWTAFLDHDDEWLPKKLFMQMEVLQRNPTLRWCGSNRYQSDGKRCFPVGNVKAIKKALVNGDYFASFFEAMTKGVCPVITSTMLIRREVFEQVGVFDPSLVRCADLDLWWRIAYRYPEIGYIAELMATVHLNVENIVSTKHRLASKRGPLPDGLIAKHLKLADKQGALEDFKPYAKKRLRKKLVIAIYHGRKDDVRQAVEYFREYFPWHWRTGAYLLTIFPEVTSTIAKTIAYLAYKLRLDKQVTRRWLYSKKAGKSNSSNT
ncbi:glycosyltransferase family 2 protein [Planctomycetota bacterium]